MSGCPPHASEGTRRRCVRSSTTGMRSSSAARYSEKRADWLPRGRQDRWASSWRRTAFIGARGSASHDEAGDPAKETSRVDHVVCRRGTGNAANTHDADCTKPCFSCFRQRVSYERCSSRNEPIPTS